MRDYGKIFCAFWGAGDIQSLTDQGKLLAAYLLTSQHTTLIGCFRAPSGYIQEDLKWTPETVASAFLELFRNGFATVDERSGWVLVHRYLVWNPIENPNQGKQAARLFEQVPTSASIRPMLARVLIEFGRFMPPDFLNGLETVSEPFLNQEQEQEQEQETTTTVASLPESATADGAGSRVAPLEVQQPPPSKPSRKASPRLSKRAQSLQIAELAMPDPMAKAWAKVKAAWPRTGYNVQTRKEAPRFTNPARAGSWFKTICEEAPIELGEGQRITPDDLADATLAWLAKKQKEAPGGRYPVVPCIENFFSCDPLSKLHWQSALLEFFGVSEAS